MRTEKSSKGDQRTLLTIVVVSYLSGIALGFLATWYGITYNSILWEKLGNLLITATVGGATIMMVYFIARQAFLTHESIEEMREDREAPLKREHTKRIQEKIVGPLLEEIKNNINIETHDFRVYRRVGKFPRPPYNGEALPPEDEHRVLFDDFMKNHATQTLVESYYKFKELARKINSAIDNLGKELEEFLKSKSLSLAEFSRLRDEERDKILKEHGWVVDSESAINFFFIKILLSKISSPVLRAEVSNALKPKGYIIRYRDNEGYRQGSLKCICSQSEEVDNAKLEFLKELIEEARNEFKEEIEAINIDIREFEEVKKTLIKELEEMNEKRVYPERCEFVKYGEE